MSIVENCWTGWGSLKHTFCFVGMAQQISDLNYFYLNQSFFLMLRKIGGYGKNFIGQFLKKYNRAFNRILSSFVQYKQKNRPFAALVWHNKFCTISAHCAIEGAEEAMRIESQPSASAASALSSIPIFSKPQQPQYTAFRCFSHRRREQGGAAMPRPQKLVFGWSSGHCSCTGLLLLQRH